MLFPALATSAVAAVIGLLFHAGAHAHPRKYYQIMWWRDLAWLIAMLAALAATLVYIAGLLAYGL